MIDDVLALFIRPAGLDFGPECLAYWVGLTFVINLHFFTKMDVILLYIKKR